MISNQQYAEMRARTLKAQGQLTMGGVENPTPPVKKEKSIHDEIDRYCRSKGYPYFHHSMAHRVHGTVGWPDFTIMAKGGRTVYVECKRPGGKLTVEQQGVILQAKHNGHTVHVVFSFDEFLRVMEPPPDRPPEDWDGR